MDMVRNMMEAKHLPNEYWAEVVATTVYIMNQCPTKCVKYKFLQEAWTSINHSVTHLKAIGCVAYAHVRDELRKNLDNKGHKCIFVGYSKDTKSYKLYDPVARKVIISNHYSICRK